MRDLLPERYRPIMYNMHEGFIVQHFYNTILHMRTGFHLISTLGWIQDVFWLGPEAPIGTGVS